MRSILFLVFLYIGIPLTSFAHTTSVGGNAFYGGVIHPFTVPFHILILAGLGLWLGQCQHVRALYSFLAIFVASVLLGIGSGFYFSISELPPYILVCVALAIGLLIAWAKPLSLRTSYFFIGISGSLIGLDSVPLYTLFETTVILTIGTIVGVFLLLFDVTVYSQLLKRPWTRIGVRVVGSWIAACSIMMLANIFR